MTEFKKTNYKVYGRKTINSTPDTVYWKQFGVPVFLKEFGPVDYIDFSPIEPHYFAVTSSVRVQIYSPVTRLLYKNLSRFQKSAYGGSFRNDSKLLCAGGEENVVKLFDISTKSLLRVFQGHTSPVHRCFFTLDQLYIASFSDDCSVGLWDIPTEKRLVTFNEHNDYVRAGAVSPVSPDVVLSGGYDNVIKMYDKRVESAVFSLNHGSPVESVIFLPSGGIFLSAGGTEVKVWDALAGGRLLARIHNHHKTVTCLRLASNGSRVLSGGLDRHVNVYDVTTFQRLHSISYPNAILSMGISANDETLAVGMVDGLVSVSRRETQSKPPKHERRKKVLKFVNDNDVNDVDLLISSENQRTILSKPETHLKKFQFTKALNSVLTAYYIKKAPEVVVGILEELIIRRGLHAAVAGNETKTLGPLLRFLIRYLGDYRFTRILINVSNVLLDVYEDSILECGPQVVVLFKKLFERVKEEINLTESLLTLEGCINLMMAASTAGSTPVSCASSASLKPSENAQDFIVNVN